jgi:hypothetical protein
MNNNNNNNKNNNNSRNNTLDSHSLRQRLEAGAFRQLLTHLQERSNVVSNMELMTLSGFCRNCLAKVTSI